MLSRFTGWAQINGRNTLTWDEKFKYDLWYTKNINLVVDLYIFLITFKKVIFKKLLLKKENPKCLFLKEDKMKSNKKNILITSAGEELNL